MEPGGNFMLAQGGSQKDSPSGGHAVCLGTDRPDATIHIRRFLPHERRPGTRIMRGVYSSIHKCSRPIWLSPSHPRGFRPRDP
ncbi:Hypothetical protein NTJ_06815 [Nesidiocoris tenuis]|uniref:Uncharacterized protein n=1 Tax=Nesidiocoris tenuis TaxID=355587 RepID=A0ABN7ASY3_9HEMI|nr:Hypothetical protein NTJ_06815 [Nesidiocoris tenuis]